MQVLCFSLIVLQSSASAAVTAVKYLGVPAPSLGYTTQSISPSIYPLRTALDVLQPSFPRYAFPWTAAAAPAGYYPAPVVSVQSPLFSAPAFAPAAVPTKILVRFISVYDSIAFFFNRLSLWLLMKNPLLLMLPRRSLMME